MARFDPAVVEPESKRRKPDRILRGERRPFRLKDSLDLFPGARQSNRFFSIGGVVTVGTVRQHWKVKLLRLTANEVNLVVAEEAQFLLGFDNTFFHPSLATPLPFVRAKVSLD